MTYPARLGTAFRWRPTAIHGKCEDLVRVRHEGEIHLALLANGYECGFSTCWPPASRLILDLFEEAWQASAGTVDQRLLTAFRAACAQFIRQSAGLITPDADFPDDLPSASLIAVAAERGKAHAVWIGGDTAVIASGFGATAHTVPHTLRERFRREHPGETVEPSSIPNVLVRTIGSQSPTEEGPELATFDVKPGDTLVLLGKSSFRGNGLTIGDAAYASAAFTSPPILAEFLAELSFEDDDSPYAAVAVVRFDETDVCAEIEHLIDSYSPDPSHAEWLQEWCLRHRALPVGFDMGGVLGLKTDGSVVSVAWDDPDHSTRQETTPAVHLAAAIGAAQKYPSLSTLAPRRPRDARDCPHCEELHGSPVSGCPLCWYLGWLPPEAPKWLHSSSDPQQAESDVSSDRRTPWWRKIFGGRP